MNIKDLPQGSYQVVQPKPLNIKDLPQGSYQPVGQSLGSVQPTTRPEPAGETGLKGYATGALKGLGTTLKGAGTLGNVFLQQTAGRAVEALTGKPKEEMGAPMYRKGTEEEQKLTETLSAKSKEEERGKFAEQVGEYFIPATATYKATKFLSFIPKVAIRAAGDVAVTGVQTAGDKEAMTETGVISAGLQTVVPFVAKPVIKVFSSFMKGIAGTVTGRGTDVIEQILKTPDDALVGLKGDVVKTLKADVSTVRTFIASVRKSATENYAKALESLPGGYKQLVPKFGTLDEALRPNVNLKEFKESGTFIADVGGEKVALTMKGVKDRFTTLLKKHGVIIDTKNKSLDFLETRLSSSEENILKKVFSNINNWKNTSPQGLDTLAAKINAYIKPGDTSKELNGILSSLSKGTREYLSSRIPGAKPMVDAFINEQKFLKELETYLGKVGATDNPAEIKVSLSKLQTLFTKNKEIAQQVLESVPGGSAILGKQAGRELSTQVPRSTSAIGGLLSGIMQTVISPKVVGQITAYTGKTVQQLQPFLEILSKLEPQARVTILKTFLSDFDEEK